MASTIGTGAIDEKYDAARSAGALGGRVIFNFWIGSARPTGCVLTM